MLSKEITRGVRALYEIHKNSALNARARHVAQTQHNTPTHPTAAQQQTTYIQQTTAATRTRREADDVVRAQRE